MPDASSVPPRKFYDFYQAAEDLTVGQLVDVLKDFPRDSRVSFQITDEMTAPLLRATAVELDTLYGITDVIFEIE